MRTLSFAVAMLFALAAHAQTADSVHTELTTEPTVTIQPVDKSERGRTERSLLKKLFMSSRKENTIFHVGFTYGGTWLSGDRNPGYQRQGFNGFVFGIDQRVLPAWAVSATVGWAAQNPNPPARLPFNTGWIGALGVNYYPYIQREIRAGRSVNNLRNQLYFTAMYWQPLRNQAVIEIQGISQQIKSYPYNQAFLVGYGINSRKNSIAYYNMVIGAGYLVNRADWVRHPVQLIGRVDLGFRF